MMLFTAAQMKKLLKQGVATAAAEGADLGHFPVVKLFTPDANCTWLLSEIDADGDRAFGLCDLGMGEPELGYVSITELKALRGRLGLPVERDRWFEATAPLTLYGTAARAEGRIVYNVGSKKE